MYDIWDWKTVVRILWYLLPCPCFIKLCSRDDLMGKWHLAREAYDEFFAKFYRMVSKTSLTSSRHPLRCSEPNTENVNC